MAFSKLFSAGQSIHLAGELFRSAIKNMSDELLIIATVLIEIGITTILIALIVLYKKGRQYTVVQLASVLPWLIFYISFTIFYLFNPNAIKVDLGFIFVMSFIFYCLSFVIGILISLVPYPKNLKMRFLIGFTSPFLLYGFRELLIIIG